MKTEAALLVQTGRPLVVAQIEIPVLSPARYWSRSAISAPVERR